MKLKKWVKSILCLLVFVSLMIACSDCDDTLVFFISHVVAGIVFCLSATILIKYS